VSKKLSALCALALISLAPAASMPSSAHASAYTIAASGVWHSNDGLLNGTWIANFGVAGYDLSGTLNLIGLPGVAEGNLVGSWDASDIGFGVVFLDQELAAFNGGLEGDRFIGTFEAGDIEGIWTGALTSLRFRAGEIEPIINGNLPTLMVDRISGKAGDIKTLATKLFTLGAPIVEIENLLNFDSTVAQILAKADGSPNCSVNNAIDVAQAVFQFLPLGCSGSSCSQVRALVETVNPIVDGVQLFTCKVRIGKDTPTGIYQVVANALRAIDIDNLSLPILAQAGEISVKKNSLLGLGDCHCRTIDEAGTLPLASLLAPLLLLVARRRSGQSVESQD